MNSVDCFQVLFFFKGLFFKLWNIFKYLLNSLYQTNYRLWSVALYGHSVLKCVSKRNFQIKSCMKLQRRDLSYLLYNIISRTCTTCTVVRIIKLMKGKALSKHSLHDKTAASVLLKPFISSNE